MQRHPPASRRGVSFGRSGQEAKQLAASTLLSFAELVHAHLVLRPDVTIYLFLIRHVLGHEILDCSEFPIAPQSSVFLRTARKLQFLGLGCQSRCLRPLDLGQCSCCCLGCCGGCLKGYTERLFSTSHGEVLRPSPFGDDQWSITGSDTVGQALAQEPLTRRAPLPCNEVQAARAAYGLLVFL